MSPFMSRYVNLCPIHLQILMSLCTIAKVKVYKALVGNPFVFSHFPEILDGILVNADRDLFLELLAVRVSPRFGEIVLIFHV